MDSFMEAQTRRAGELMEGFIGQTLNFYENIRREMAALSAFRNTSSRFMFS